MYNFFFIPPAHLCAVTYMTETSLIVTLNNQFTLPYLISFSSDKEWEGEHISFSILKFYIRSNCP